MKAISKMDKFNKTSLIIIIVGLVILVGNKYYHSKIDYPRVSATATGVTQPTTFQPVKSYLVCDEGHTITLCNKMLIKGHKYMVICRQHYWDRGK